MTLGDIVIPIGARVFIHPRCVHDKEAVHTLAETLTAHGIDTAKISIYQPPGTRRSNVFELVRDRGPVCGPDGSIAGALYERWNGEQFTHWDSLPPRRA